MKPITSGQKEQVVNFAKDATRKAMEEALSELEASGALNGDNVQRVIGSKKFTADIRAFVKQKLAEIAELIVGFVRLISGAETLELEPTDGKATIAKAGDLFTGWVDADFKNWGLDVKGEPTKAQKVQVYEMVKDGTLSQIFAGLSEYLDVLCLTQEQIIQFVKKHHKWLRTDGWGTFFLFKVGGEFFVASVDVGDGRLGVGVRRLSSGNVWRAEFRRRIVVPQLALANQS